MLHSSNQLPLIIFILTLYFFLKFQYINNLMKIHMCIYFYLKNVDSVLIKKSVKDKSD